LHQTPEAKSVMHPHHAATVRTLVVLVRGRWKRISKAVKIHFLPIRWPEPLSLVMIDWAP